MGVWLCHIEISQASENLVVPSKKKRQSDELRRSLWRLPTAFNRLPLSVQSPHTAPRAKLILFPLKLGPCPCDYQASMGDGRDKRLDEYGGASAWGSSHDCVYLRSWFLWARVKGHRFFTPPQSFSPSIYLPFPPKLPCLLSAQLAIALSLLVFRNLRVI